VHKEAEQIGDEFVGILGNNATAPDKAIWGLLQILFKHANNRENHGWNMTHLERLQADYALSA
jgi:hypothetical protein